MDEIALWTGSIRTKDSGQGLSGVEELGGSDSIVLLGVDGDIDERLLEGLDDGTTGRNDGGRHDGEFVTEV